MFRDVVTRQQTSADWPDVREEIRLRILETMGQAPPSRELAYEKTGERDIEGLRAVEFVCEPIEGWTTYGTICYPPDDSPRPAPGAVCPHGSNHEHAHRSLLMPVDRANRAYAWELAERGFVTLTVDQLGFGEGNEGRDHDEVVREFYRRYPDWSLDGARLRIHRYATSILSGLDEVDQTRLGCMGNSLGGRHALFLSAFDERIQAAVASTGISPNVTNVYRNPPSDTPRSPRLNAETAVAGHPTWEYQELMSLAAPRGLLALEPYNDPYNPFIEPVMACYNQARRVWQMLDRPAACQLLCHGYGHDTPQAMRAYAYAFIEEMIA